MSCSSLPCATRRGGLGRGAVRGQARQRVEATTKVTPSQPPPWLRQRGGARLPPLRSAQGRVGEGCCSQASQRTRKSNNQSHPLPTSPLAAPKGRGQAPSLAQRAGEGWGGVLFAGKPDNAQKQQPKPPPPNLSLGCAKGEGLELPPLRNAQGRAGEGCYSRASQTPRRSNNQSYPLPASPLAAPKGRGQVPSLAQRAGEGWGGGLLALSRRQAPAATQSSSGGSTMASSSIASLPAISTAWVRLVTPSLRRMAVTWALMVASETPRS